MKKIFLIGLATTLLTYHVQAQETSLFPELQGQFKPAVKTPLPQEGTEDGTPNAQVKLDMQQQTPDEVEMEPGKISLSMEKVRGTMAYAKNYSYCFAEAVVYNDTAQKLEKLTVELVYGKTPTKMTFSGVNKKSSQTQQFMMIGEDCALIKGTPEYTVEECQLGNMRKKACEGRFQFIPPQ